MMPLRDKFLHLRGIILPIFLIMAVMGSIFLGVTTVSEAAGVGALGAIIAAAIHRKLNWNLVKQSIFGTIRTTGMIMWITIAAYIFVGIYLLAGGDKFIRDMLLGFGFGPWGVLIIVQLLLILLGMVLDWIGILVLVVPIVVPLLVELGFSPIWFGILFCVNMQIAYLSPPFGYAMFYLKGVAPPEISMTDLYRSVWPFIIIQLIGLAIIMAFPQTALWLPSLMGK
jgi:tripartite ATP-independent transporter DctM subunit